MVVNGTLFGVMQPPTGIPPVIGTAWKRKLNDDAVNPNPEQSPDVEFKCK